MNVFLNCTVILIINRVGIADQIREVLCLTLVLTMLIPKQVVVHRLIGILNYQIIGRVYLVSTNQVGINVVIMLLLLPVNIMVMSIRQHLISLLHRNISLIAFRTYTRQGSFLNNFHTTLLPSCSLHFSPFLLLTPRGLPLLLLGPPHLLLRLLKTAQFIRILLAQALIR